MRPPVPSRGDFNRPSRGGTASRGLNADERGRAGRGAPARGPRGVALGVWALLGVACTSSGRDDRSAQSAEVAAIEAEEAAEAAARAEGPRGRRFLGPPELAEASPEGASGALEVFEGIFDIDRIRRSKHFQGSWLRVDGGEHLLLNYRPMPEYFHLVDRRVIVEGRRYHPQGQAIMAHHLRVESLRLADGEPPAGEPLTELPLPPRSKTGAELRARVGGWAVVHATLIGELPSELDGDWPRILFRLDDGTEVVTTTYKLTLEETYRPRFGSRVTVLGSVHEKDGRLGFGTMIFCVGDVESCGRKVEAIDG